MSDEARALEVRPEPTGASHEVGAEEMFFSTTDERGVITDANSVFVRLSRYPLPSLLNAPHSIIRHPDMPGGAFEVMWQTLNAGDPFCAYVDNLAADGQPLHRVRTVTPLADGGYLSVRTRPLCLDLLETVRGMYAVARPKELQARDGGASAHQAAVVGLADLAAQIEGAGIGTYLDVMHLILPAEIEARRAAGVGIPHRPDAEGSVGRILGSATELSGALDGWSERQEELAVRAGSSIVMLCRAMSEGFELTRNEMSRNADLAHKTVELIADAGGLIAMPTDLIENWRDQVAGRDDAAVVALIPLVEEQIRAAHSSLDMLTALGERCAGLAVPYDTGAADAALDAIRREADTLVSRQSARAS